VSAVEVSGLAKRYGAVTAVAHVSLRAEAGQVTAVLGPNGAGKTTTVEACAGLRSADAGTVSVLGLDPRRDGNTLRPRVGVMPQGGSSASGIYPSARVGEVLRLHAALHTDPLPVDVLLDRLSLTHVARSTWRRLSGGEQQRLSVAVAMAGAPQVLLADEPTSQLDSANRDLVVELLGRVTAEFGTTVVVVTHDPAVADATHRRVTLAEGRVADYGYGHPAYGRSPYGRTPPGGST
jgi:ABC-2 type transport system ATP-binding protein